MKRVSAALALVVAALLTACGGADTLSFDAVAQAADKTAAQQSSRFEMSMQMTVPGAGEPVRMFASGAIDYAEQRLSMTVRAAGFDMTMLFDEDVMYMKMPALTRKEPGAPKASWVKLDLSQVASSPLGGLSQFGNNPADQLELLRALGDDVEKRGTKKIRGVATTHYHASIDLADAVDKGLADVPETQRERVRRAIDTLIDQTELDQVPVDVFLDAQGLLRRMIIDMSMDVPVAGEMRMLMTMDLFDFGAPVSIQPPPAGQMADVTGVPASPFG